MWRESSTPRPTAFREWSKTAGEIQSQQEEDMHARVTRYEGAAPEAIEEALQAKKQVLPTEFGQTEDMKGAVFLVDRQTGTIIVISLWQGEEAMQASEDEATRVREEVTGPGETATVERYEVALLNVEQGG
jgi:membrane peptidoglycan carboxypeptidase